MTHLIHDAFATGLLLGIATLVVWFFASVVRDIRLVLKGKK